MIIIAIVLFILILFFWASVCDIKAHDLKNKWIEEIHSECAYRIENKYKYWLDLEYASIFIENNQWETFRDLLFLKPIKEPDYNKHFENSLDK